MRFLGKTRFLQLAVAAAVVAVCANDAMARSRGSHGSYGSYGSSGSYASYSSYGSYGSSGSYASYSSYGSYGSYGSSGSSGKTGLFARWHARKAAKHSYGSYGSYGNSGSSGSSGSYVVSYGSSGSYGSYGSSGSSGSSAYYGEVYDGDYTAPVGPPAVPGPGDAVDPAGAPATPPPAVGPEGAPPTAPSASANEAEIFVSLPEDSKVYVNELATTSTGAERHYVSRGLQSGQTYTYKLRVEFQRDGQPVIEDKLVRLQAGRAVKLAFGNEPAQQAATEVKLHVPADAKVTLAGAATQQTGEVRTFESTSLKPGQKWSGYVVRVELEKDGKTLVEERSIDIEGGKTYELSFEMTGDATKVASVN